MTKEFLKGAWKAGIVSELDDAASSGHDLDGGTIAWAITNMGTDGGTNSLVDGTATGTYAVITEKGSATIDDFGPMYDTYQALEDDFDHDIEIRKRGGGSIEFVASHDGASATAVPLIYLIYAATHFPNGFTNIDTNVAFYNAAYDVEVTKAADHRGYAIILEQQVSASVFYQWIFHNAKIGCSISPGPQKATRATLTWEDARYISVGFSGSTFGDHADA